MSSGTLRENHPTLYGGDGSLLRLCLAKVKKWWLALIVIKEGKEHTEKVHNILNMPPHQETVLVNERITAARVMVVRDLQVQMKSVWTCWKLWMLEWHGWYASLMFHGRRVKHLWTGKPARRARGYVATTGRTHFSASLSKPNVQTTRNMQISNFQA